LENPGASFLDVPKTSFWGLTKAWRGNEGCGARRLRFYGIESHRPNSSRSKKIRGWGGRIYSFKGHLHEIREEEAREDCEDALVKKKIRSQGGAQYLGT